MTFITKFQQCGKKKKKQLSVSKGNAETEVTFPSAWKASCTCSIFRYYRSAAHAAVTHRYRTTLFSSFLREFTVWRWKGHSLFQVCLKRSFLERSENTQRMVETHLGLGLFGNLCVTAEGPCWFIQSPFCDRCSTECPWWFAASPMGGKEVWMAGIVLEGLQEKSPSNVCYYSGVNCLQWNQEFTVYFCALLLT